MRYAIVSQIPSSAEADAACFCLSQSRCGCNIMTLILYISVRRRVWRRPDADLISQRRARRRHYVISRHTVGLATAAAFTTDAAAAATTAAVMLRRQTNYSSCCGYCTGVTGVRLTLRPIVRSNYAFSNSRYYLPAAIIARLLICIRPIQSE